MLNKNSVESKTLSLVRTFLSLLIVFIHTNYQLGIGDDSYRFFSELISGKIAIIAVPCFFMISGYLFSYNENIRDFIIKKIRTIVIPYFTLGLAFDGIVYYF